MAALKFVLKPLPNASNTAGIYTKTKGKIQPELYFNVELSGNSKPYKALYKVSGVGNVLEHRFQVPHCFLTQDLLRTAQIQRSAQGLSLASFSLWGQMDNLSWWNTWMGPRQTLLFPVQGLNLASVYCPSFHSMSPLLLPGFTLFALLTT